MSKKSILVFLITMFLVSISNITYSQLNRDSIFISWNKATFQSLERQTQLATDLKKKDLYRNRLDAFKAYLEIDTVINVNMKSIRYQFLDLTFSRSNRKRSILFVVEANETGYTTILRNFVVYVDSVNKINVKFYIFQNGKWRVKGKGEINSKFIENDLKEYITNFGHGFNKNNDVIVTRFENRKVTQSEYYLIGTLSNKSSFKDVIDCYKADNFIK